jgi:PIN domain nuclease of toxin-antitoxin system
VNDDNIVVDASAVVALLAGERFDRFDPERVTRASISAVNFSEVLARLAEMGLPDQQADAALARLSLRVVQFDEPQARVAAQLKPSTRRAGLSLGDRACLALGLERSSPVITADRAWASLDLGIDIVLIR